MAEFPDMKGLSYRNLKYIRQWYQFYNEQLTIWQQVVAKLDDVNMQQLVAQLQEGCLSSCLSQLPTIEDIEATLSDIKETKDFKKG